MNYSTPFNTTLINHTSSVCEGLALGIGDTWGVLSCPPLLSPACSRCTVWMWFCNSASVSNFTLQLEHRVLAADNEDVEQDEDDDETALPFPSPGLRLSPWIHAAVVVAGVVALPCCCCCCLPPFTVGLELLEPAAVTQDAQSP